jgi:glycosyltransferase involved in cell wall biosynthesis
VEIDLRRHVLFLIPSLTGGGAERVFLTLLKHLSREKFHLTLAVVDKRNAVFLDQIPQDVDLVDLGCMRVRQALPKIILLIWRLRPSVVFSTLGHLNLALVLCRKLLPRGVRFIARETSIVSCVVRHTAKPWLWSWAYRRFYARFDRLVCQSNYMAKDLIDCFGMPASKISVVYNPVDRANILALSAGAPVFQAEDGILNLLAAGRLDDEKGFDLLIRALALCADLPIRLTVIGEGPLLPKLEALSLHLGVGDKVRFAGFQNPPYPYLAQADLFVLSSRYEGFPNVVLEALACGTPVVATPAPGGIFEILDGVSGCVMAREISEVALADAIRLWLGGNRYRIPLSCTSRFDVDGIVSSYESIFLSEAKLG